jgi:hypothetical protein
VVRPDILWQGSRLKSNRSAIAVKAWLTRKRQMKFDQFPEYRTYVKEAIRAHDRRKFRGDLLRLERTNPKKLRRLIIKEKGGVCYYCGKKGTKNHPLELAHVRMLNMGAGNRKHLWLTRLGHIREDVVPAHRGTCNPHINPLVGTEEEIARRHQYKIRKLNQLRRERLRLM